VKRVHQFQVRCAICNKPVNIEAAATDDKGKTVHRECYVLKIVIKPSQSDTANTPAKTKAS
jgi:hypothetical protein